MNIDHNAFNTPLLHSRKTYADVDIQIGIERSMIHTSFLTLSYLVADFDRYETINRLYRSTPITINISPALAINIAGKYLIRRTSESCRTNLLLSSRKKDDRAKIPNNSESILIGLLLDNGVSSYKNCINHS